MVHNIVSGLEVMVSEPPDTTTKEDIQEDQPELTNDHTPYGNINRAIDSLKHHMDYDSSAFSPVYIDIKTKYSIDTVYKHDLVNKIGETWLADPSQYTSFEDMTRTTQMDDGANTTTTVDIKKWLHNYK